MYKNDLCNNNKIFLLKRYYKANKVWWWNQSDDTTRYCKSCIVHWKLIVDLLSKFFVNQNCFIFLLWFLSLCDNLHNKRIVSAVVLKGYIVICVIIFLLLPWNFYMFQLRNFCLFSGYESVIFIVANIFFNFTF